MAVLIKDMLFKEMLILFLLLVSAVFSMFSVTFISQHIENQEKIIKKNIEEYGEFDISHTCRITDCNEIIIKPSSSFKLGKNGIMEANKEKTTRIELSSFSLSKNGIEGLIKVEDVVFFIPISNGVKFSLLIAFTFAIFFLIGSYIFLYYVRNRIKEKVVFMNQKKEMLDAQLAKIIGKNIFHEIKTPISSIAYELSIIEEELEQCGSNSSSTQKSLENIKTNLSLIENIAYRTRADKINRKKNQNNNNVYDILEECFTNIRFTDKKYTYSIDDMFKTFFLDTSKLSKEDFQNVIVNHTKNSFEADAETIIFKFVLAENKFLVIDLIDDGNGIPKSLINKVYELDFSTKSGDSGSRGIGLYLCREILRNAGGDDRILETSKNGTTIELKIPII